MMAMERESNGVVYVCGSDHTCGPDVRGFAVAGIFDDFGGNVAERMEDFCSEKISKGGSKNKKWTLVPMTMSLSRLLQLLK